MSSSDEVRVYLESLVEHQDECTAEGCSKCAALQSICDIIRERIFDSPVYARVAGSPDGKFPAIRLSAPSIDS